MCMASAPGFGASDAPQSVGISGVRAQVVSAALGEVWIRWKNTYRYAPEDRMRKEVKRLGLDQGIKGDALKEMARVVIENALVVVNKGSYQWKRKKR
jgi:hypothetical protein